MFDLEAPTTPGFRPLADEPNTVRLPLDGTPWRVAQDVQPSADAASDGSSAETRSEATWKPGNAWAGHQPEAGRHTATTGRLPAHDGVALHYRAWLPAATRTSAALVFVHGIASHGGWFSETGVYLAERGIAVYAPDRRGSGLSEGPRGHIGSREQAQDDLDRFVSLARSEQPGRPIFLVGSSWAARLAIAYAAESQNRLAGLLLHGPGLFPRVDLTLRQKLTVLLLHRTRPAQPMPIPFTVEHYSGNLERLMYVRRDPHRLTSVSARFYWETRQLDRTRDRDMARLTLPVLLQIGQVDPIVDTAATCRWFDSLRIPDRTSVVYRNAAHTLDFEPGSTTLAYRADLLGWLTRQIGRAAERAGTSQGR